MWVIRLLFYLQSLFGCLAEKWMTSSKALLILYIPPSSSTQQNNLSSSPCVNHWPDRSCNSSSSHQCVRSNWLFALGLKPRFYLRTGVRIGWIRLGTKVLSLAALNSSGILWRWFPLFSSWTVEWKCYERSHTKRFFYSPFHKLCHWQYLIRFQNRLISLWIFLEVYSLVKVQGFKYFGISFKKRQVLFAT